MICGKLHCFFMVCVCKNCFLLRQCSVIVMVATWLYFITSIHYSTYLSYLYMCMIYLFICISLNSSCFACLPSSVLCKLMLRIMIESLCTLASFGYLCCKKQNVKKQTSDLLLCRKIHFFH